MGRSPWATARLPALPGRPPRQPAARGSLRPAAASPGDGCRNPPWQRPAGEAGDRGWPGTRRGKGHLWGGSGARRSHAPVGSPTRASQELPHLMVFYEVYSLSTEFMKFPCLVEVWSGRSVGGIFQRGREGSLLSLLSTLRLPVPALAASLLCNSLQ